MKAQGKIRILTADLAKALAIIINKDFQDEFIMKSVLKVYQDLSAIANSEDTGLMMSNLNSVEEHLRNIASILYQRILGKKAPTKILYYSGMNLTVNTGSQIDFECIGYRKVLLLFVTISVLIAFYRTKDQSFLKILDVLHKATMTSDPKDRGDIFGNSFLVRIASMLFLANQENSDQVKSDVFRMLNIMT